ncbi:MAG: hypothetical protein ACYDBB_17380 [Armatimonadota bacterium]
MAFFQERNRSRYLIVIGLLLLLATPASANAGTLLIWAEMGHLFFGNLLIGMLEALFIARLFKIRYHLAMPLLVPANYASMASGAALVMLDAFLPGMRNALLGDAPLYRLPLLLGVMTAITLSLSVLLEWPFYRAAFTRERALTLSETGEVDERRFTSRRIFSATVYTQLFSYLLLTACYLVVSGTGLIRNARVTPGLDFAATPTAKVYFLKDGANYRVQLDGSSPVQVSEEEVDKVIMRYLQQDGSFHHFLYTGTGGDTFDLRPVHNRDWRGRTHFWETSGLELRNERTGERCDLGLELPFVRWRSERATILPGDQVVYQLGPQIVLFDINTRRLACIARGSRPVVALK